MKKKRQWYLASLDAENKKKGEKKIKIWESQEDPRFGDVKLGIDEIAVLPPARALVEASKTAHDDKMVSPTDVQGISISWRSARIRGVAGNKK